MAKSVSRLNTADIFSSNVGLIRLIHGTKNLGMGNFQKECKYFKKYLKGVGDLAQWKSACLASVRP
jgi:hypothetical protein